MIRISSQTLNKVKYLLYLYAHLYDDFSSDIQSHRLEVEHILPKT
ncbi:hypothetical protein [Campylobacter lanienae]|nr:hypothetical protein [Campylobacter lanienae]